MHKGKGFCSQQWREAYPCRGQQMTALTVFGEFPLQYIAMKYIETTCRGFLSLKGHRCYQKSFPSLLLLLVT